jgi:hypothetical protein
MYRMIMALGALIKLDVMAIGFSSLHKTLSVLLKVWLTSEAQ